MDKTAAKVAAAEAKKAARKAKPSCIVILQAGSSILSNMAAQEAVLVEESSTEEVRVVRTSRSGRAINLPIRHR